MKLVDNIPNNFHIRLRDQNQRDDINVEFSDFLTIIINNLTNQGTFDEGIYDPELLDTISSTENVGNILEGTLVSELRGLTFTELWNKALFTPAPPIYTAPQLSLAGSGNKLIEVGITLNPVLTGTFTQNNAGAINDISLTKDGIEIGSTNPYTDTGLTTAVPDSFAYVMTIGFDAGAILNDSQGNPFPAGSIQAGSIISNTVNYNFIYPYFWGISNSNTINVATIIAGNKIVENSNSEITINFNSTPTKYLWFAVPSTVTDYDSWFVNSLNQGNIGNPSDLFDSPTTVAVTTVNWNNINYKLYVSSFTTEVTENMTIN